MDFGPYNDQIVVAVESRRGDVNDVASVHACTRNSIPSNIKIYKFQIIETKNDKYAII